MTNIGLIACVKGLRNLQVRASANFLLVLLLMGLAVAARGGTPLVPASSVWRYIDNGSNQGTAWRDPAFNDQSWKSGAAELGYGDGDETTVVGYGGNASNKYITTYFRHTFNVEDPASFEALTLNLLRDDGAVVYLNGVEVLRSNMPGGTVTSSTLASSAVDTADESIVASIGAQHLITGSNVLAVEIHQANATSSDISFDLALAGVIKVPSVTVVPAGSTWKYLDNGSAQGTEWRAPAFNDNAWASGPAELGYGDGGEQTVVNSGPSTNKYITTYFRHSFDVVDPAAYTALKLRLMRDDGAIVYLNGTELHRSNMPAGTVSSTTFATVAAAGADESAFFEATVANLLVPGTNVLAVEVHQADVTSTDVSFDFELLGLTDAPDIAVVRGPYLQNATPTSMVIRWRTDIATTSKVWFGTTTANLAETEENVVSTTEHEVLVSGLLPNTQYYYAIGSGDNQIASGSEYTFFTPPTAGTKQPIRVWVLGDSGTANTNAAAVRNAYETFNGDQYTDMWLMLGDNAYNNGTDAEFQAAVFNMYPSMLRQSPLWSTLGNHEYYTAQGAPYFDIHTFPTQGEAGGAPSGTEKYYSFDYGNVHFICLDSMSSDRSATGPMATWLQADLESTTQDWIVAFWHHPPYTKGSHDSDSSTGKDLELVQMRENFLPLLEAGGVDLVLGGHSHSYERSYLLDGHYGFSQSFSGSMKKDSGDGREVNGIGAYTKPVGLSANQGAVYAVAGSSGKATNWWGGSTALVNPNPHPAMVVSLLKLGSMVLDVDGNRLDVKFLNSTGGIDDQFTIKKEIPNTPPTVAITSPMSGATVEGAVTITANATPGPEAEGGSVSQVDFYSGNTLIGSATTASVAPSTFEITWSNATAGSHTLTAVAWDDKGATTTSAAVTVTVKVNAAPVVSITSPTQYAAFFAPATIGITANASDDGSVAQVAFYEGENPIGTDTAAPFEVSWANVPAGTYQLTAKATDDKGVTATSTAVTVTVSVPNEVPVVTLTSPVSGSSFRESTAVQLAADASDSDGTITQVEFYAGAAWLFTDTTEPYNFSWESAAAGSYELTAVATDNTGAKITSAPVSVTITPNQAPTVSLTSPTNAAVFTAPATVLLTASADDSDGSVARVEFYSSTGADAPALIGTGTKLPDSNSWTYSWDAAAAGNYALTAVAVDNNGKQTTSAEVVSITINPPPNVAPAVSLTSPASGASFREFTAVQLAANASDSDGTVTKVEFYAGATLLHTDVTSPYAYDWTGAAAGTYELTAVATDNSEARTTSAAVSITVNPNVAPAISLTSPINAAVFTAPATIPLAATATDADGSVARVEFYSSTGTTGPVLVGTGTKAPEGDSWTYSWNAGAAGSYALTAVAVDNNGARTTSADVVNITINPPPNVAPTVSISGPAEGASYMEPAEIAITATAADSDGTVTKVDFYWSSATQVPTLIGSDVSAPFSATWSAVPAGAYALTAIATDNSGDSTTSAPVNVTVIGNMAPTVSLTSPTNDAVLNIPATVSLKATAEDADGSVDRVEFYASTGAAGPTLIGTGVRTKSGKNWTYNYTWEVNVAGTYTVTAVAVDNDGARTTSVEAPTITVNPPPNVAPTVSITGPAEGANYMPLTDVLITATATDSDGTVAKVDFYWSSATQGQTLIGADTTAPFSATWGAVPAGTYVLTAVATDNSGGSSTSAPVNITVGEITTLAAPTNLVATAVTRGRIDLSWVDNSNDETGFYIERSLNGSSWSRIGTVGANVETYRDSSVSRNTLYYYRVQAYKGTTTSGYSNIEQVRSSR